jgi:hypothetical protein
MCENSTRSSLRNSTVPSSAMRTPSISRTTSFTRRMSAAGASGSILNTRLPEPLGGSCRERKVVSLRCHILREDALPAEKLIVALSYTTALKQASSGCDAVKVQC